MQLISLSTYPSQTTTQTDHCLKDIQSKILPSTVCIFQHSFEITPCFLNLYFYLLLRRNILDEEYTFRLLHIKYFKVSS